MKDIHSIVIVFPPNNNLQGWKMGAKSLVPEPVQFRFIYTLRVFDTEAPTMLESSSTQLPVRKCLVRKEVQF